MLRSSNRTGRSPAVVKGVEVEREGAGKVGVLIVTGRTKDVPINFASVIHMSWREQRIPGTGCFKNAVVGEPVLRNVTA